MSKRRCEELENLSNDAATIAGGLKDLKETIREIQDRIEFWNTIEGLAGELCSKHACGLAIDTEIRKLSAVFDDVSPEQTQSFVARWLDSLPENERTEFLSTRFCGYCWSSSEDCRGHCVDRRE